MSSEFERKVGNTHASIVILLEKALAGMAEQFIKLGEALRGEGKDAEDRAAYLQSQEGRNIWGSVWKSEVLALLNVLRTTTRSPKRLSPDRIATKFCLITRTLRRAPSGTSLST